MTAWRRLAGVLLTGAAAALVTGASIGAADAVDTTWTVTPGGAVKLTSHAMVLRDDATGTALSCTSSTGSGGLNGGTSPNRILGTITALTFTGCTSPQGQPFTITMERLPFYIGANTYNATTGVLHGIIYRVAGKLSGPGCTATLGGTSTIHTGRPKFNYVNSGGKLKLLPGVGTMQISNVTGCADLFNSGATPDPASFAGAYTVSPKQAITSP